MIISIETEKPFDKIQPLFMIKTCNKTGNRQKGPRIIKAICENPTGNIILIGERLNALTLTAGTRQECPLLSLLFN